VRINRYLAQSALASRRKSEEYILEGKVKVNGKIMTDLSYDVKNSDMVTVDNKLYKPINKKIYIMLNKPKGYITTTNDEKERKTVMDLIDPKIKKQGVFPIGRLDYNTEGLLILTNDGDTAYKMMHPKFECEKEYKLTVFGHVNEQILNLMRQPIMINGRMTRSAQINILNIDVEKTELSVRINEGKNRQIRQICETAGVEICRLQRVSIGGIYMKGLKRGACRPLTNKEIAVLTGKQ
jgi:23S rRNA pseudouridine2605 synthase